MKWRLLVIGVCVYDWREGLWGVYHCIWMANPVLMENVRYARNVGEGQELPLRVR